MGSLVDAWAGVCVRADVPWEVGVDVLATYSVMYGMPLEIVIGEDY